MPELKKSERSRHERMCHNCHKKYEKKSKWKVCKCHSITYCGPECQEEDWLRHKENCVPVMITEIPGKGVGLVASKDFKAGEEIFTEYPLFESSGSFNNTPELCLRELCEKICKMSADMKSKVIMLQKAREFPPFLIRVGLQEKCLEELKRCFGHVRTLDDRLVFFLNKIFINHSCAPNAFLTENLNKSIELRAIKNISKGEEVSHCYLHMFDSVMNKYERRKILRDVNGFDCRCTVCTGEVPDQEEILMRLRDDIENLQLSLVDWQHGLSKQAVVADLAQKLYIGQPKFKYANFFTLFCHSFMARDPVLLEKSFDMMRKLVENTQLDDLKKSFSLVEKSYELWHEKIIAKIPPTEEEIAHCAELMVDCTGLQGKIKLNKSSLTEPELD